jgi:hypothetical protein
MFCGNDARIAISINPYLTVVGDNIWDVEISSFRPILIDYVTG